MILGENKTAVIENIKSAVESEDFYAKVEIGDPVLSNDDCNRIVNGYLCDRQKTSYKAKAMVARRAANILTKKLNEDTEIVGIENALGISGGAIITSNHFSPTENTVIRMLVKKLGKKRLNVVSQVTNFAMPGAVGFLMNYADTIPLSQNFRYLDRDFIGVLDELTSNGEYVLIYPEQEMWFNYRKPRPLKRGAYHFAAKLGVPIISCFIEMIDTKEPENQEGFNRVRFKLHVLKTIYPDPEKSVKENSLIMCETDYNQKKEAYEKAYHKPLDYEFAPCDIAGWQEGMN